MNNFFIIFLITLFSLIVSVFNNIVIAESPVIQSQPIIQSQEKLSIKLQKFINELEIQKNELQGGTIAILYKDQVVYKTTFGKRNGNSGIITSSTLFPLASASKAVSSIAIALMVDKDKIDLNEQFQLPYLKNQVSLKNILSHTTGYSFSGNAEIEKGMTRVKLLHTLQQKHQPKCLPGKCYRYSNAIFSLLEEGLNQKKLSLQSTIDNMKSTLKISGVEILPLPSNKEIAYPHSKKVTNGIETILPLPFPPYYPKTTPASAGIFASLDGMIEIYRLCFGYRPDIISKKTLDIIHQPVILSNDILNWGLEWPVDKKMLESHYGLGWRHLRIKNHREKSLIFHSGYINGINSFIGYIPSEEVGMIILLNQRSGFPLKSGIKLWGEFLHDSI